MLRAPNAYLEIHNAVLLTLITCSGMAVLKRGAEEGRVSIPALVINTEARGLISSETLLILIAYRL